MYFTCASHGLQRQTGLIEASTKKPHHWGSIIVCVTSRLTRLNLTKQIKLFFSQHVRKAAKSKQNKHEVSRTLILISPMTRFLCSSLYYAHIPLESWGKTSKINGQSRFKMQIYFPLSWCSLSL